VREPIAGLHVDCVDGQYTVLAATPTRLYCFTGGNTLQATLTGPGGRGPRGGGAEVGLWAVQVEEVSLPIA
jgi:hypothetical protein